jgi:hypothetical protein
MALKTIILTGSGTWTVPADWNNAWNSIHAIGGGGAGTRQGGGGGGAYATTENFYFNPGDVAYYSAVSITAKSDGNPAWFSRTNQEPSAVSQGIKAAGGRLGNVRTGGSASSCIPSGLPSRSGGNGAAISTSTARAGAGGGGAGGPNGNGAAGRVNNGNIAGGGGGAANGGSEPDGTQYTVDIAGSTVTYMVGGRNRNNNVRRVDAITALPATEGAGGDSSTTGSLDLLWADESGKYTGPTGGGGGNNPGQETPNSSGDPPWAGNPVCFLKGTLIDTPDGRIKIEDLKEGDFVYSFDIGKNKKNFSAKLKPKKILRTIKTESKTFKFITIVHEFGTFKSTNNHKILTIHTNENISSSNISK